MDGCPVERVSEFVGVCWRWVVWCLGYCVFSDC